MKVDYSQSELVMMGCTALIMYGFHLLEKLLRQMSDHLYDIKSEIEGRNPLSGIDDADAMLLRRRL